MDGRELKSILAQLGWSQTKLARMVKINKVTVGRWIHGKSRVPGSVEAYLSLVEAYLKLAKVLM